MKPTAFHIPSKSVMAGAKPYKPAALTPCNYFRVVGLAHQPGRERPTQCHAQGIDMRRKNKKACGC